MLAYLFSLWVLGCLPMCFCNEPTETYPGMARAAAMGQNTVPAGSAGLNYNQQQAYKAPEYKAPEYKAPEYKAPEYKAPEYKAPEYKAPEYKAPEYKAPEYKAPEYKAPEVKVPDYKAPDYKQGAPSSPLVAILNQGQSSGQYPEVYESRTTPQNMNQATAQTIQRALTSIESVRQALMSLASQGTQCVDGCDLTKWRKCTCINPATYDAEGRGNCNFGATKLDTKVWCYIDPRVGDPRTLCPDAQPSPTKPGYFWSRFACIT